MFWNNPKPFASLSMEEARREMERDPAITLLDVRSRAEYETGHIPGSINLPVDRVAQETETLPHSDARIFVYCQSGGRSRTAATLLSRMGYINVTDLGGIMLWRGELERSGVGVGNR